MIRHFSWTFKNYILDWWDSFFCFSPPKNKTTMYHLHIPKICFNLYHICCLGCTKNNQKYFHFTFSNQLHFKAKIVKFLQIFESSKWYILCQITFLQFHSLKWHVTHLKLPKGGLGSQIGTLPTSFHAYATLQPYSLLRRGYTSYDAAPIWTSSLL